MSIMQNIKTGNCIYPLCKFHARNGEYCERHTKLFGSKPKKGRTPIIKKAIDMKLKKTNGADKD